jgi:hypothetical protein
MEKYKYGPLVYITINNTEEDGNFYWAGETPVGYDNLGIPIDSKGDQCLPINCPLHPHHVPTKYIKNEVLNEDIPDYTSFKPWFDDHFLVVTDYQLKKYVLRWYSLRQNKFKSENYRKLLTEKLSIDEMIDRIWPDEPTS